MRIFRKEEYIPNCFISASEKDFFGAVEAHGHNFFELEYILEGEGEYTVDGVRYSVAPNRLFLMSPAAVHKIERSRMRLFNIMFLSVDDGDLLPLLRAGSRMFSLTEEDARFFVPLLSELVTVQEKNPNYAALLLRCILHRLTFALEGGARPEYSHVPLAMLYVREHFAENITLKSVAEKLGISYSYLSDLFVSEAGMGFKEYLDGVRLTYARNLITLTEMTVGEVCERAGFGDYANFSRRFRAAFGMSARDMRRASRLKQNIGS